MPVILLFLILGCGPAQQGGAGATPRPTPEAQNAKGPQPVIVLERKAGYWGLAPEYKIVIHADGSVVYSGKKNVKTLGEATGIVTQDGLQQLLKAFESIDYFSLLDTYGESGNCPSYITDGPLANTWVKIGGREKSVRHDSGCMDEGREAGFPKGLTAVEELIDRAVGSKRWVE